MKACPTCFRLYPAAAGFCPQDGTPLLSHEQVPAQSSEGDRLLGTQLCGRYEVRRIVADGGMGRVYEARDTQQNRRVAIKVLHPEVARDPIALERFKREYDISKDLPHAHIVEVLDFQQADQGQFIMVMEFLDGEELRALLKRERKVGPAKMVRVLSQVAIGLDEAHRREFVHRDLKPDNVFLCDSEAGPNVKLLDFGSVRINKNRQASKLTSLGTTIGSPFYMSPEQAQGVENLDHRADVFALGAIAYEALTGEVPFSGANGPAILLAILTKTPAPISTKGNLPPALDDVIDDALAKKPETRTPSVGALADGFGHALGLAGDHAQWAQTPVADLERMVAAARPAPRAGAMVVDDPFAADPFAAGAPPPPPPPPPPAGMQAPMAARAAMDDAFAAAGAGVLEPAGVPQRPLALLIIGALVVLVAIGGVVALALR
ncbi:MAG: serine/threonine protein kinase [Deltaproteobacteria bacterium]|nr:serine/threonine protein kinase [Deltaproteobacteria bacterium]